MNNSVSESIIDMAEHRHSCLLRMSVMVILLCHKVQFRELAYMGCVLLLLLLFTLRTVGREAAIRTHLAWCLGFVHRCELKGVRQHRLFHGTDVLSSFTDSLASVCSRGIFVFLLLEDALLEGARTRLIFMLDLLLREMHSLVQDEHVLGLDRLKQALLEYGDVGDESAVKQLVLGQLCFTHLLFLQRPFE